MTYAHTMIWLALSTPASIYADAEVVVRDPDGKPVANRLVRVVEVAPFPSPGPDAPKPQEVTTDREGRARLHVPVGVSRLQVRAAGIGFGATGLFEAREKQVARPELPRLARFARVEGTINPSLFKPPMRVDGRHSDVAQHAPGLDDVSAPCDAEGRFVLEDVVPGELHLHVWQDQRPVAVERIALDTVPGQTRRGVVLSPPQPRDPVVAREEKATLDRLNWTRSKEEITWVEGTVRDPRGGVLEGAEVMVKGIYYGGIRNYSDLLTTRTDAKGHYQIRGPHSNFQDSFTVVVRSPHHAPVLAYARAPGWDDKGPRGPLDLTVPDRGGAITVRVVQDGKPVANVPVALREQGFVERIWSRGRGNQESLDKLFNPVERTDKEGVARFTDLFPCRYQLRASMDGSGLRDSPFPGTEGVARAIVPVVAVAAGENLSLSVALRQEHASVALQALRPDGTEVGHQGITFSFGLRETYASSSMNFDTNGAGTYSFTDRGLWAVGLRFRDTERSTAPLNWEPYYEGSALLPISPGFKLEGPVKLRCELHSPGSIQARLVGLDGKPARGTILMLATGGPDFGAIDRAASTDDDGVARFPGLTSGSYRLRGSMEQYPRPYLPLGNGPLPDDAALRDQIVFTAQQVKVDPGTETRLELQPVRAGYVRGRITPPPGAKASDYFVFPVQDWLKLQSYSRRDAARGEYLCGPLLPGKVEIRLRRQLPDHQPRETPHLVTVAPGEVTRIDLEAKGEATPSERPAPAVSLGMGGLSTMVLPPEAMAGTVFHADGVTPAFGASAMLMVPKEIRPMSSAVSDAAGRLTWTGLWIMRGNSSGPPNPPGQVTTPTVVVSLPGLAGASVIALDPKNPKPFRAVLPSPRNASGRVTLGGQGITTQDARVRVIAGHRGSGVLDGPLSVEAVVEPDGQFTLPGLTPGAYQVQAARDGIWLSRPVMLRVTPDQNPAELVLDVPDPGAAVTLALVDEKERPAGHIHLKLARPEGPLAELWPVHFSTGADGTLMLRGLEVGAHQFRIDGENAPRSFEVPRVTQGPARRVFTLKPDPR